MKKLKAAVIGVGYLGTFHAQKYKNNHNVELVGVFDVNKEQAQKVASDLKTSFFYKIEDLVGKVDLATISTTTQSHFMVAEYLIKNGIHVNIEKPITANVEEAKKLIFLAKEKNVKLAVGHIERFNPAFIKFKQLKGVPQFLEFERMGPFKARGADVSVVHDLMIHDLDLLMSLNPGPVLSIQAQGKKLKSQSFDWAVVWMAFASGLKVCLKASRVSSVATRVIRSFDQEALWTVNLNNCEIEKVQFGFGFDTPLASEKIIIEKVDGLQKETDIFIDSVMSDKSPMISGEDGMKALELVERICSELQNV